jgi:hypothetical protein
MSNYSSSNIGIFAEGMYNDLGQPSGLTASAISGWAIQPNVLGKLNNLTNKCYYATGDTAMGISYKYDVYPALTEKEFGLLDPLYRINYYQNLVRSIAGANGVTKIVQSISEGDQKITFANMTEMAKVYNESIKEETKRLNYLANAYEDNQKIASTVDYYYYRPAQYNMRTGDLF